MPCSSRVSKRLLCSTQLPGRLHGVAKLAVPTQHAGRHTTQIRHHSEFRRQSTAWQLHGAGACARQLTADSYSQPRMHTCGLCSAPTSQSHGKARTQCLTWGEHTNQVQHPSRSTTTSPGIRPHQWGCWSSEPWNALQGWPTCIPTAQHWLSAMDGSRGSISPFECRP